MDGWMDGIMIDVYSFSFLYTCLMRLKTYPTRLWFLATHCSFRLQLNIQLIGAQVFFFNNTIRYRECC